MQVSEVSEHKGWKIYTFCHEDSAEGWTPGDPLRYHAWGSAEEGRVPSSSKAWRPTDIIKIPPAYFDDFASAHKSIKSELIRQIAASEKIS
jgi:hypothetical protein